MTEPTMLHPGHGKHLCYLNNLSFQNSNEQEYKELVKNPEYLRKKLWSRSRQSGQSL